MPEKFMPRHFGRELTPEEQEYWEKWKSEPSKEKKNEYRQKLIEARDAALSEVPDLPPDSRRKVVSEFINLAKDVRTSQRAFKAASDPEEKTFWAKIFTSNKSRLDSFLSDPGQNLQLEKTYREWVRGRAQHAKFLRLESDLAEVEADLAKPAFSGETKKLSVQNVARLERLSADFGNEADLETGEAADALKYLYTETELADQAGKMQYEIVAAMLLEGPEKTETKKKKSKGELEEDRKIIERKLNWIWEEEPGVQYHEAVRQLDKLLGDLGEGKNVLELPSTVHNLNQLAEWERLHPHTTVGAVLVGEPGTGKTTLVHHYLEQRGRNYVYLDFSEEVTRYTLFGTKALEFKSTTDYFSELAEQISRMDDAEFEKFIKEHAKTVSETYHLAGDEAEAAFFQIISEELKKASDLELRVGKLKDAREKMEGKVGQMYRKELAGKFKHLIQKNGWRDGVLISALRRGDSVICDEFVKMRDLTLIYGLLTSRPGDKWYFADNDEEINIPEDWRMYFTANIGRRHGGYKVAEALASRAEGKVMEVVYPPAPEELTVALASLCDSEGWFLRGKDDIARVMILIKDVFPKIRTLLKGKEPTIPISWRTIRDIGEKLVETKEADGKKIHQKTKKTFDQALYEVLVESYRLYEDRTVPKEIVNICTSVGLMVDNNLKRKIVDRDNYLPEEEFDKRQELRDSHKKDWQEIVEEIKGERLMHRAFLSDTKPERRSF